MWTCTLAGFSDAFEDQVNDSEMVVHITRVRELPNGDAYEQPRRYVEQGQVKKDAEEANI